MPCWTSQLGASRVTRHTLECLKSYSNIRILSLSTLYKCARARTSSHDSTMHIRTGSFLVCTNLSVCICVVFEYTVGCRHHYYKGRNLNLSDRVAKWQYYQCYNVSMCIRTLVLKLSNWTARNILNNFNRLFEYSNSHWVIGFLCLIHVSEVTSISVPHKVRTISMSVCLISTNPWMPSLLNIKFISVPFK